MDAKRFSGSPTGTLTPISGTDARFGPYQHVAFVPHPLESEPPLSSRTWHAVTRASLALGKLQQVTIQMPEPDLLRVPTLRREAQATSELEGTYAPLEKILQNEIDGSRRGPEITEILNYVHAANHAFESVSSEVPIGVSLLQETHSLLVRDTGADGREAGHVRQSQVVIGSGYGPVTEARFIPMPPGPTLEASLRDLLAWIREPSRDRDPVVAAAMAHYQFECIHPFNDGNGRIGRLLVVLQLMHDELLNEPILSISNWFVRRRTEYQDRLASVSGEGDWDGWVRFFAHGLEVSADDTAQRAAELLQLQQNYRRALQENKATGTIVHIAHDLIARPYLTVQQAAARHSVTFPAASRAVQRLVALGILKETTGRESNRIFCATEVVQVLARI